MSKNEMHLTSWIDKSLYTKVKKKVDDSQYSLRLKECMAAGLILVMNKNETQIRNIIKKFSSEVKK